MAEYVTIQGDTWDGIAYKLWQVEAYAPKLISANINLRTYQLFPANVRLNVPDVTIEERNNEQSGLPPWRRWDEE